MEAYRWTFGKAPLKFETKLKKKKKNCERFLIKYYIVAYSVTMDLQIRSFIFEPAESCLH